MNTTEASGEYTVNHESSTMKLLSENRLGRRGFLKLVGSGLAVAGGVAVETSILVPGVEASTIGPVQIASLTPSKTIELYTGLPEKGSRYWPNAKGIEVPLKKFARFHQQRTGVDVFPNIQRGILDPFDEYPYNVDPSKGFCATAAAKDIAGPITSSAKKYATPEEVDAVFAILYYGVDRAKDRLWGGAVDTSLYAFPMAFHHLAVQYMGDDETRRSLNLDTAHRYGLVLNMSPIPSQIWCHAGYRASLREYSMSGGLTRVESVWTAEDYLEANESRSGGRYPTTDFNIIYVIRKGDPTYLGQYLSGDRPADFWRPAVNPSALLANADDPHLPEDQIKQVRGYEVIQGINPDGTPNRGFLPKNVITSAYAFAA